jgi:N-acetylglucosamine-6-phosphate deacetylase
MADGMYTLGQMQIEVHNGRCIANDTLAGSVLTLDQGVRNFAEFTGASLQMAVAAATRNPSRLVGIEDCWGTVEEGRVANITVLSDESQVIETFLAGQPMRAS